MPGVERGSQRPGEQTGTPAGLYMQPQMAASNKPQWPGGTPYVVTAPSREKAWQQQQQDLKHREYLKQQQRLKAMGVPNNKNVSADALIGNLLEKKDTFRPKQSVHGSAAPGVVHGMPTTAPVHGAPPERAPNEELPPWIWPGSPRLPPLYTHIWTLVVDPASGGTLVDTNRIFPLLLTSGLPTQVLGFIWNLAGQGDSTPGGNGQLTQQQLYIVLALVALAQTGCTFNSLSILKMLPQPPIPMFNMGAKPPPSEGTAPIHGNIPVAQPAPTPPSIVQSASTPFQMPVATPPASAVIPNTPIPVAPTQLSLQQPTALQEPDPFFSSDPKEDDFTEFQSADIPTATVVQPSSAAKQVVSELNHSVIARLGNQGRSIGSRLANHTLGAPKSNRNHHHKHHRSERRPSLESPYFDDEVTFGGGRPRKVSSDNSYAAKVEDPYRHHHMPDSMENDDFEDFQMAIGLNVNVDELFPKCKQTKKHPVLLKESAIRNESVEREEKTQEGDILSLDSPHSEHSDLFQAASTNINLPKVPPPVQAPPQLILPPPSSLFQPPSNSQPAPNSQPSPNSQIQPPPNSQTHPPPNSQIQPPPSSQIQPPRPATQTPGGKELMTVQEDKYSALRFLELETPTPTPTPNPSDDFGDFVSAEDSFAEIAERKLSDTPSLFSACMDIKMPAEDSFSEITERTKSEPTSLFADSETSPPAGETPSGEIRTAEFPVDEWLTFQTDASTGMSRPALEDLSSIFSSLNVNPEQKTIQPQIEISRNEETEDEFGDFVGPEIWGGDDNSGKLPATLLSDNRSISSFEMTNSSLSRHGSLPSLDLKIFPQGDDFLDKFKEGCVPINEWQKCLDCCVSLLQSAVNSFASISQDVVLEVLGTSEGLSYFINLKEVRNVCNRIQFSYYRCGQELNQIETSLKIAQQAWDSLDRFYKLADIDTVDGESREESEAAPCSICCCPASTEALEYNGHSYHASCANLWLNCSRFF